MKVKCLSGEVLILKNTVEMCEISLGRLRQTDTTVFNTRNNPGLCVEDMSVFHLAFFQGVVNIHVSFNVVIFCDVLVQFQCFQYDFVKFGFAADFSFPPTV